MRTFPFAPQCQPKIWFYERVRRSQFPVDGKISELENYVFISLRFRYVADYSRRNPFFYTAPLLYLKFLDDPLGADQWFFAIW